MTMDQLVKSCLIVGDEDDSSMPMRCLYHIQPCATSIAETRPYKLKQIYDNDLDWACQMTMPVQLLLTPVT